MEIEVKKYTQGSGILLRFLEKQEHEVEAFWELLEYNAFAVQLRYEVNDNQRFDFAGDGTYIR